MFLAYHITVHHILDIIYSSVLVIENKHCVDSCYVFHIYSSIWKLLFTLCMTYTHLNLKGPK